MEYYKDKCGVLHNGAVLDVLRNMPSDSVNCVVTSPPYWGLRDYSTCGCATWRSGEGSASGLDGGGQCAVCPRDPDPNCKNCHGTGKVAAVDCIWDGSPTCAHGWGGGSGLHPQYNKNRKYDSASAFCAKCWAWKGQLGLEPNFHLYIKHLCDIFDEIKRVLKKDGTCWVNIGDSMCVGGRGSDKYPRKSHYMIPERFAMEMVNRGWILRRPIIWHKPNAMPQSFKDNFTQDYEYLYFFTKSRKYHFEQQFEDVSASYANDKRPNGVLRQRLYKNSKYVKAGMIKEDNRNMDDLKGAALKRNKRSVWAINTKPFPDAHFAVFPEELVATPIKAGCPDGGVVLDLFVGSGTVCMTAKKLGMRYVGIDINIAYLDMAIKRIKNINT